ncbi:MAG: acetaldehyde dehydrogenase (acetylating) [Firmicutes bacterium]|nr:acetaldehyde dehydrogenase (acetylating) [Bacillota bacterium]
MALDTDLQSIQEARDAVRRAAEARAKLASLTQEQVDRIVAKMAEAGRANARALAKMAVEETGFGVYEDKITKNLFASERVYEAIRDLKTVGIIRCDPSRRLAEIAEPVGLIVALVPSTNPTSTVIYKSLISLKARNPIVFSPHPSARRCSCQAAQVMADAAAAAGAPRGAIQCLVHPTKQATDELMHHPDTALILATGGSAMVKAAYSAGKPAYGVGPGNVPAFIERTADIKKAVSDIFASKTFDNGTICASEQAIVTESVIESQVVEEVRAQGGYFLTDAEAAALSKIVVTSGGNINPSIVGRSAETIARMAGISVPDGTRVLVARLAGVGPEYPLSREKLSPILAFYVEPDWLAACERCIELLNFGGIGHSLVIHSRNPAVIREFAMKKPVFRILVNTPSSQGAIGATTGLDPALTLGCGTWGGSITADNVGPLHLVNVKRVAFGLGSDDVERLYMEVAGGAVGVSASCKPPGTPRSSEVAVPTIIGPAAAVDRPVMTPLPVGSRSQGRNFVGVVQSGAAGAAGAAGATGVTTAGQTVRSDRERREQGRQNAAQSLISNRRAHQTRLVTDEDIRAVVDRFLSGFDRSRGN